MDREQKLIATVAETVAVPKAAPADSFVLHAPLELLARALLLRHVHDADRDDAVAALAWLASEYEAAGDPVSRPRAIRVDTVEDACSRLVAAITAGELDDVDRLAFWLGSNVSAHRLPHLLAGPVVASLAAAAHSSILFHLLPRVAGATAMLLRGPVRELARNPEWRLRWFEDARIASTGRPLIDALLAVPSLGVPGSEFIFPIMNQAEESGIAAEILGGTLPADPHDARRALSRVAAWSMLQEPPDHAPYGWTHCLTMPQAVIALAGHSIETSTAVAVASTYVVGFRAALGQRTLDPMAVPSSGAAAAVWDVPDGGLDDVVAHLATRASLHHDAHFVKYTLACLDAGAADPANRRLYLAAAASLAEWWAMEPSHDLLSGGAAR